MEQREFIVEQETAGQRIDRFLSGEDTGLSRSALQALEAGLPAQEEALRRQQADIQERAQELSARAARCAELDAETERRAQELPHENRAAAQRALVETRTQCEALQQALAALVGVSGGSRIVGIISHVAELKDRIDRQIIVTKDRSGGSRVQVQA